MKSKRISCPSPWCGEVMSGKIRGKDRILTLKRERGGLMM